MDKRILVSAILLIAPTTFAPGLHAQDGEVGVRATIMQVFEGMHTANPEMVRAMFAPDARFAVISTRNGPAVIAAQAVDGWIEAIGQSGGSWDEQVYDLDIDVDGDMASAWVPYTFYLEGAVRHCGINSIELLRDADGWKVTQLSDTRRTENCPDPLGRG
ncbi:MAG: nuclear transport factor 2 family protein [Gemmatimonadota bacterium]|nr:nuclear transport factor 2 family protein [Gemmatimonadota bacterium]